MSDLGAIFHVKKNGVQYDAHAYTTLDECPYPNLKIKFNGQQAYVKMEQGKGNGNVPCYVKTKAGNTYQVIKEVKAPTGQVAIHLDTPITLTIPAAVKVLNIVRTGYSDGTGWQSPITFVGVTPGTTHIFEIVKSGTKSCKIRCNSHSVVLGNYANHNDYLFIKWSEEINKEKPTVEHYT